MSVMLLQAEDVHRHYETGSRWQRGGRRVLRAVDGVSLAVARGEMLGIVGESGCGKSTLARCLVRLAAVTSGSVRFDGVDITHLSGAALRRLRRRMQMVFQDTQASLNPRRRVAALIADPLHVHGIDADVPGALQRLAALTELPEALLRRFPHELSGGQRQRVGIARALATSPDLLVADEPVSALDVSVQARILNLLMDLQENLGLACVLVSHDLGVIRQATQRVAVMYLGVVVETGGTEAVLQGPAHPYTAALLQAVPSATARGRARVLLPGEIPGAAAVPAGCRFHPRCARAEARCRVEAPVLRAVGEGRAAACHFPLV